LVEAKLLSCESRGRHRYFMIADAEVAQALQALALVAERATHERAWQHPDRAPLREARCCYGHLAGRLGVALHDILLRDACLRTGAHGLELTDAGRRWLQSAGLEPPTRASQCVAHGCLDWSERRDHLAGPLARMLLQHFLDKGWLLRARAGTRGGHRVIVVTHSGRRELLPLLNA
jgi:hypothetical protein